MALTVKQIVNRHGAFVSAVTGLLVGAAIVVIAVLQTLINYISVLGQGLAGVYDLAPAWPDLTVRMLTVALPVAVGYFLSLWVLAPIAEELRVPHVVTRAILATGVGATLYFIVGAIIGIIDASGLNGSLYSQALPGILGFDGSGAVAALGRALTSALLFLVSALPLGILAGVLLWLWRKDHPPKRPLAGLIDEV